jgi:serine/threonine protein kinase
LLDASGEPLLTGFEVSRFCSESEELTGSQFGTPLFMAPEVWEEDPHYTDKVDVFSFGVFLCTIFAGRVRFTAGAMQSNEEVGLRVRRGTR